MTEEEKAVNWYIIAGLAVVGAVIGFLLFADSASKTRQENSIEPAAGAEAPANPEDPGLRPENREHPYR